MDQGRNKTVDAYARQILKRLSGKQTIKSAETKLAAQTWLADLIFTRNKADSLPSFQIDNPQIADAYGIKRKSSRRYSYNDLSPASFKIQSYAEEIEKKEKDDRSLLDKEFLRIYANLKYYESLKDVFKFLFPNAAFTLKDTVLQNKWGLEPKKDIYSFWEIFSLSPIFAKSVEKIAMEPKTNWGYEDSLAYEFSQILYEWSGFYQNSPFVVIPLDYKGSKHWIAPWDVLSNGLMNIPYLNSEMHHLKHMAEFYNQDRPKQFLLSADSLFQSISQRSEWVPFQRILTENFYNKLEPFYRSNLLYGFGLLLALFAMLRKRSFPKRLWQASILLTSIGILLHTIGILLRMYISERPPVTNLYETFVFVGWTCVIFGLIIEYRKRDFLGLRMASFSGLALGLLALKNAPEGDTMGVLVAVLDSNFWLSTHVITITLGYAGTIGAGVLGHQYLYQCIVQKSAEIRKSTYENMMGVLAFGLCLSFVGTILGGIWADQSWGRFWGWDPKENGALLIVLWIAILYHSRLAGWLKPVGLAAGSCIGIIIVMLAWFGINLLGVGLHSYGFTDGAATALLTYCGLQLLVVFILAPWAAHRVGQKIL
jgi:ABC-type transport system involved in cytochrome c biogenesis permease subunit